MDFRARCGREAEKQHWGYEVVGGREEGMLLYLQCDHFLAPKDAVQRWQSGQLDALVVQDKLVRPLLFAPLRRATTIDSFGEVRSRVALFSLRPGRALKAPSTASPVPLGCVSFFHNEPMEFPKAEIETLWCPWRVEYFERKSAIRIFYESGRDEGRRRAPRARAPQARVSHDESLSLYGGSSHGGALSQDGRA